MNREAAGLQFSGWCITAKFQNRRTPEFLQQRSIIRDLNCRAISYRKDSEPYCVQTDGSNLDLAICCGALQKSSRCGRAAG